MAKKSSGRSATAIAKPRRTNDKREQGLPEVSKLCNMPWTEAREELVRAFERAYVASARARFGEDVEAIAEHAQVDKSLIYRLLRRNRK